MGSDGQLGLFLSQAEGESAREIERLLGAAFHGRVRCFNTAVAGHGMTAGDQLSPALQAEVLSCDLFISIWSPRAVEYPAWIAWELGVAVALGKPVKVYRVLGTTVEDLPLGLGSRYVPDLGQRDQFVAFCEELSEMVPGGLDTAAAFESFVPDGAEASRLWSQAVKDTAIRIARRADRLLIENVSNNSMTEIQARAIDAAIEPAGVAVNRALARHGRTMAPGQRIIVSPRELGDGALAASSSLRFEWMQARRGRLHQTAAIRGRERPEPV